MKVAWKIGLRYRNFLAPDQIDTQKGRILAVFDFRLGSEKD